MPHKVLLVDDDVGFQTLLKDVFEQTGYQIILQNDPQKGLQQALEENFDLVVVDQKMPGLEGTRFIDELRTTKPDQPLIMVSAYLDNQRIRDLIQKGVKGVFIKPLNVFSLLKRASEAIEQRHKTSDQAPDQLDAYSLLGFHFHSFPCKHRNSLEFAHKLYAAREFKAALLLTGPTGTHFKEVCKDFESFCDPAQDRFFHITPRKLHEVFIQECLKTAKQSEQKQITFVVEELEELSPNQSKLIYDMAKKSGAYAEIGQNIRFLFCLHGELDTLYEKERIDENTYILMGTNEIRIPGLKDCPDDIPFLAQKILIDLAREKGFEIWPKLEKTARSYLREQDFRENYAGLHALLKKILVSPPEQGEWIFTSQNLGKNWSEKDFYGIYVPVKNLEAYLRNARNDYALAAYTLLGKNLRLSCDFLNVDSGFLEKMLNIQPKS